MGEDMLKKILRHVDDAETSPAAETPPEQPQSKAEERHTISVPSWLGCRVVCSADLIEQNDQEIRLRSEHSFEQGQYVWVSRGDERMQCVVEECVADSPMSTLRLKYQPDRRKSPRRAVAMEAEIEWLHGLSRVRIPASFTNLSESGAQLRLQQSGPEQGEVVIRYDSRTREATVRYSMRSGDSHLVGVEFSR